MPAQEAAFPNHSHTIICCLAVLSHKHQSCVSASVGILSQKEAMYSKRKSLLGSTWPKLNRAYFSKSIKNCELISQNNMGQCSLNFLDGIRFDKACDEGKHRYLNTKIYLFFKAVHCDILAKGKNTTVFTDGLTLRLPNCCWISCFQASSASQHGTTVCYVVLLFKNVFVEFLSGYIYTWFLSMYGIKQKYISIDNMCCIVSSSGLHQLATKTPSGAALGLRETQPSTAKSSAGSSWAGETPKKGDP